MEKLLPDQLKELWQSVVQKQLTTEAFTSEQERLLAEYRNTWKRALLLEGYEDLPESIFAELGRYVGCEDLAEVQLRCTHAVANVKREWQEKVDPGNRQSVEQFYDESQAMLYELMGWHTLCDDASPLAYVTALRFAQQRGCRTYLDFGAGVGSGGILFARHGLQVALADISSPLLRFSQWRLGMRGLSAQYLDLKASSLPSHAFDLVTAMDVFEHLLDPAGVVEELWKALKPRGFLFARISAESDEERPQHIVQDFGPTFERLRAFGFLEVWRDEWLWGHQVFQKSMG
ncbi:MAG: class I SAM-dependent methyltransferase [Nitrospinae bacterium]|nr:class I SAM-dependent methyltransferase [Nitrospinota bacterium]